MARIRCNYIDCIFLDDGFCSAPKIEIDPDLGCMTFSRASDMGVDDPAEIDDVEEWDEIDDDDDLWLDDDDDF